MKYDEILSEIVHTATGALLANGEEIKKQALADIVDACAAVLPTVERTRTSFKGWEPAKTEAERMKRIMTIAEGVTLKRYRIKDRTEFIAVNKAGSKTNLYKIVVAPHTLGHCEPVTIGWKARFFIDEGDGQEARQKFELIAGSRNRCEKLAVSAAHRWLKETRRRGNGGKEVA